MDRTSLPCVWLEAPHKQTYDQGGPPKISVWNPRGSPRGLLCTRVPNRNPLQTQGLPTSRITTREAPHKQNYDKGGRITTKEPTHKQNYDQGAGWLVGWRNYNQGACHALGWLAGWLAGGLAGWLAEAQRGPERPGDAQRGPERPREAERG